MARHQDDRERRWRDDENRFDRDRWRNQRTDWREQERDMERQGWQGETGRGEGSGWMDYGRGENWNRENRFGGGMRHRGEDYDFEQSRRMSGGEDWGYGRMGQHERDDWTTDYDRGFERGGRGQEYFGRRTGRQDWDTERSGTLRGQQNWGRGSQQDWGRGRQDLDSERNWTNRGQQDWGRGQQDWGRSRHGRGIANPYDDYDYDYDEPMEWTYTEIWEIEGPFTGMGPSGYHRSDDRIFEDVCERLTMHGQIDPSDVEIEVENGEVVLKGSVDDRHTKRIIEDVAYSVSGVTEVQNNLRVTDYQGNQMRNQPRYGYGPGDDYPDRGDRQVGRGGMYSGPRSRITGDQERTEQGTMYSGTPEQTGTRGAQSTSRSQTGSGSRHQGQMSGTGSVDRSQIREGMQVIGSDDGDIGKVKEVHGNEFLVDRPLARDVFVPFHACRDVSGNRIRLNVRDDEVNDQGWRNPDILGDDTK